MAALRWMTLAILALMLSSTSDRLLAQKKKDDKDAPPQVVVALPLAIDTGKTTKVTLRGLKLDTVTELRVQDPKSTGKIVGKSRKITVPPNANASQVGDSEIDIEITLPKEVAGVTVPIAVIGPNGESKPHQLIVRGGSPILMEKEPNDGFKQAQTISIGCIVEGSIKNPQDVDVFRFEGKQGDKLIVELQANRFGSPLDGLLTVHDEAGRIIANADDSSAAIDPVLRVSVPRTGAYYLSLIDAHDQGGSIYLYRLIVRLEK